MIRTACLLACLTWAQTVHAQAINLPVAATETVQIAAAPDTLSIATGGWNGALPQKVVNGTLTRGAWKLVEPGQTTRAVLEPLRDQLVAQGYSEIYSCPEILCGGFDFRFAVDVLPPPEMQINLGDYQYWAGEKEDAYAVILASRIADTVYVQIDRIGEAPAPVVQQTIATRTSPTGVTATLETDGRVVLSDLTFAPGTTALAEGTYPSLATLAVYLNDNPSVRVALVGHTDTSGPLDINIAISKRRAASVRQRLIDAYGVGSNQIAAEGMGYLAPLTSNGTDSGREANRRVEVILLEGR